MDIIKNIKLLHCYFIVSQEVTYIIFHFILAINGYISAKYYKYFGGKHWATNIITSAILFQVKNINYFTVY